MLKKAALTTTGFLSNNSVSESRLDLSLLGAVLGLLGIGLVMVGSASMDISDSIYGNPFWIVGKQVVFIFAGLFCMLAMMTLPVEVIKKYSVHALFVAFVLLILVLFVGREINGSKRWIPLGFFNLQASELAKVLVIIFMASFLDRRLEEVRTAWSGFFKPIGVFVLIGALLLLEPDFGSVVVLGVAVMGMIFMAGARMLQFVVMMILAAIGLVGFIAVAPYRMARLASFRNPWEDAFGSGYQLTQSLIAFGRGEFSGEGLGNSIQKLFYLPEAHTDFIYAVLAEELGFVGAALTVIAFTFISLRALQIAVRAEKKGLMFHGFVAYGIGLLFACQSFINICVNTGLLPTKGLALPLISYGGSSLIVSCFAFGILLRIDYERRLAKVVKEPVIAGRKRDKLQGGRHGKTF